MSIEIHSAVIELSLVTATLNRYFLCENKDLAVTINPANDVDLQGIRIASEHAVIILGYDIGGPGIEGRVYSEGRRVHNFILQSENSDQRKNNLLVLIQILEGIRQYGGAV